MWYVGFVQTIDAKVSVSIFENLPFNAIRKSRRGDVKEGLKSKNVKILMCKAQERKKR